MSTGHTPGTLWFPEPPTVNHLYRRTGARVSLTDEAREWRRTALAILFASPWKPHIPPVAVRLTWYRSKRRGDVDNITKAVLDALAAPAWLEESRGAYYDDGQVLALVVNRCDLPVLPGVAVEVLPVPVLGFGDDAPQWARGAIADVPSPVPGLGWHEPPNVSVSDDTTRVAWERMRAFAEATRAELGTEGRIEP